MNMCKPVLCFCFGLFLCSAHAQKNLKISLSQVRELGKERNAILYEARFKVLAGTIDEQYVQLALPLPNGKKGFVRLETYGEKFKAGESSSYAFAFKAAGCQLKDGQTLVSHDLAPVKAPPGAAFKFQTGTMFLGEDPKVFFGGIKNIEGVLHVGDALEYVNHRGQKSRGVVVSLEVENGLMTTDAAFEGLPDHSFYIKIHSEEGIDFSDAIAGPVGSVAGGSGSNPAKPAAEAAPKSKARIKTIPVNTVLENAEVKITVHNLVKFNPVEGEGLDIFKVDYSLDYYIVDATFENKSKQALDCGEYLLRFNFFSADGKSADEFTRVFKAGQNTQDEARKAADKVDTSVFGGTGKLVMANVLVKYQATLPDYDTKHKPDTDALNKPLAPGRKIRSIDATIMGVPPDYKIEGLGTWKGAFFDKKNLLFKAVNLP